MLRALDIRDLLIIDRLEIAFQPGLNVLTGETGAGKSILLDSLGFVLGWRGRAELVRKLVRGHFPCISAEVRPYFNDVADHVDRVQSMVDGLLQVLSTVFEFSSLLEAQRTGVITRQLAAWAAILAVPTAIAGIYGMNFKNMPELDTAYGYFVVLGLMLTFCLFLFVRFKRAKWL